MLKNFNYMRMYNKLRNTHRVGNFTSRILGHCTKQCAAHYRHLVNYPNVAFETLFSPTQESKSLSNSNTQQNQLIPIIKSKLIALYIGNCLKYQPKLYEVKFGNKIPTKSSFLKEQDIVI